MRIDLFLKLSRLIKQREAAKQSCERGLVRVDGRPVKPSQEVRVGDRIFLDLLDQHLEVEVLELPSGNVSKARSHTLYRVIS